MSIQNLAKIFSISIVLIVFAFLINNYLTFAGNWPGAFSSNNFSNIYSIIQFFLYLFAVLVPIYIVYFHFQNLETEKITSFLENTNSYIIRFAFWSVLLVGIIDALISLLVIEGFFEYLFGKSWHVKLSNNSFRAPYIHFPLIFISLFFAYFFKSLNFFG